MHHSWDRIILWFHVETDWNIEEQFIVDIFQPALAADSVNSSHPLTYDVYTPEEIDSFFDTISYYKGQ